MPASVPVIREVIEEHLDGAAFLWERWERELGSPLLQPAQVADRIEERLLAHVEGLALGSSSEWALEAALGEERVGTAAAAAAASLELHDGLLRVLDAIRGAAGPRRSGLVRALSLSRRKGLERDLLAVLKDPSSSLVAAALEALAFRRVDVGPALLPLLGAQRTEIQIAALRAARATAQPVRTRVERSCDSALPHVREAAIEAGLLLGFRQAYVSCQRLADSGEPGCPRALLLLAMGGNPADLARIERALEDPVLRRAALVALGHAGRSAAIERILGWAEDRDAAPLVGEAFSTVTGIAIERDLLAVPEDDEEHPSFEEDDLDAELDPGAEGELPVPNPEALRKRWRGEASRFDPGQRYLGGRLFTPEVLLAALLGGSMRRRRPIAFELAVRTRRELWVETSGWASEQLRAERQRPPFRSEAREPFARFLQA